MPRAKDSGRNVSHSDPDERRVSGLRASWARFKSWMHETRQGIVDAFVPRRVREFSAQHPKLRSATIFVVGAVVATILQEELIPVWRTVRDQVLIPMFTAEIRVREGFGVVLLIWLGLAQTRSLAALRAEQAIRDTLVERDVADRLTPVLAGVQDWQVYLAVLAGALAGRTTAYERQVAMDTFLTSITWGLGKMLSMQVHSASICVRPDREADHLRIKYVAGVDRSRIEFRKFRIGADHSDPAQRSLCGLAWDTGATQVASDVLTDARVSELNENDPRPYRPYRSMVAIPLVFESSRLGVVCFDGTPPGLFDTERAKSLAEIAAGFVASAMHLAEVRGMSMETGNQPAGPSIIPWSS